VRTWVGVVDGVGKEVDKHGMPGEFGPVEARLAIFRHGRGPAGSLVEVIVDGY